MPRYDYIVVGGGSAGCVAASELACRESTRVLLLEGGDPAQRHPETLQADRYKDAFVNEALMWERFSEPQTGCGGSRKFMGSGRGLGGSGSINAMVYTRGAAEDYDAWPDGWRWSQVVADFEAIEKRLRVHRRTPTRFTETCIDAAEQAGFRRKDDLNDGGLDGVLGYEWMNYEGAARRSSYVAYLMEEESRANLTVITGARVRRVLIDADGRAEGVEYEDKDGLHRVRCQREVLLAAGALESPKILMLSGVGPPSALRRFGIPVVCDAPSVGKNLHDHPNVTLFFHGREEVDCKYPQLYGFHRAGHGEHLARGQSDTCYVFYPARSSLREGMIRLLPGMMLPKSLYRERPVRALRQGIDLAFRNPALQHFVNRVYGIVVILGKPKSRGQLSLRDADPATPAILDPAYFESPDDMNTMVRGVQLARRVATTTPLATWGNRELIPGRRARDDRSIARFVQKNAMTTYHYAGTCKMGESEHDVVDSQLRVRGVRGLRVVDASVIPETPVSALNAPSMLIGYRGARFTV